MGHLSGHLSDSFRRKRREGGQFRKGLNGRVLETAVFHCSSVLQERISSGPTEQGPEQELKELDTAVQGVLEDTLDPPGHPGLTGFPGLFPQRDSPYNTQRYRQLGPLGLEGLGGTASIRAYREGLWTGKKELDGTR